MGPCRSQVQGFIQQLLEDEVAELLGRVKSERREAVDAPAGSRNGHGKPRQLALLNGTITVWRGVREGRARHEQGGVARADRRSPKLTIADGHLGIWSGLAQVRALHRT
jgi:hypothetical protein